jgi:hypothetical protein
MVQKKGEPAHRWQIAYVGSTGVMLPEIDYVGFKRLAEQYELNDGSPLSVREPVPFAG